ERLGGQIVVWRISDGPPSEAVRIESDEPLWAPIFMQDSERIATFSKSSVRIWTTAGYREERKLVLDGDIAAISISPDGNYIVAIVDLTIYILDAATGNQIVA